MEDNEEFQTTLEEFKELFKAVSGEDLAVDKEQLKDIFETMGLEVSSDAEFDQQFSEIDTENNGYVHFTDLEQYLSLAMISQDGRANSFISISNGQETQRNLSLEAISALTKLFEDNKFFRLNSRTFANFGDIGK